MATQNMKMFYVNDKKVEQLTKDNKKYLEDIGRSINNFNGCQTGAERFESYYWPYFKYLLTKQTNDKLKKAMKEYHFLFENLESSLIMNKTKDLKYLMLPHYEYGDFKNELFIFAVGTEKKEKLQEIFVKYKEEYDKKQAEKEKEAREYEEKKKKVLPELVKLIKSIKNSKGDMIYQGTYNDNYSAASRGGGGDHKRIVKLKVSKDLKTISPDTQALFKAWLYLHDDYYENVEELAEEWLDDHDGDLKAAVKDLTDKNVFEEKLSSIDISGGDSFFEFIEDPKGKIIFDMGFDEYNDDDEF